MRVDVKCSCGAEITVAYEAARNSYRSEESGAQKLLEQFRRDHKQCRVVAMTKEGK